MTEAEKKAQAEAEAQAKAAAEAEKKAEAEAKKKPEVSPEQEKMNRYNSLREQAIALRDSGQLAPVAVVEWFAAGTDSDFDEIEAKLKSFSAPAAE